MEKQKPVIPRPNSICMICQEHGSFLSHANGAISVFCEHHSAGGIGRTNEDGIFRWLIVTPVTREVWVEQLLAAQLAATQLPSSAVQ